MSLTLNDIRAALKGLLPPEHIFEARDTARKVLVRVAAIVSRGENVAEPY